MCPHRGRATAAVVAALIVALAPPAARAGQTTIAAQQAVFPVRVSDAAAGSRDGLCVAIAQEATGGSHLVYLITSARLVGSGADWTARIVVGDDTLVVGRADAMVDPGGALALLRAVSSRPVGTVPVFLESVPSGSPVVAAGFRANGGRDLAAAHFLRRGPVAVVVLDTTGRMDSRVGAPVLIDRGVLALATRDTSGSDVIVEELAGVGAFLLQRVPGLTSAPPAAPLFTRTDREINGPTLEVPLDRTAQGEIDVPLDLGPRETILGATAHFVSRTPLRLGDITIVRFDERRIRLRFTLGGEPPPRLSAPWPPGQALVVLRVSLISEPSR